MRALVTGGSGFIGSNIVDLLVGGGYSVRVLDNLSSGYLINIQKHINNKNFEFVGGDVRDSLSVERAMDGVDVVFHLAASVGRQRSLDNPQLDSEVNLIGTVNVLEAMRKAGTHRIVYSSSAAMFGELVTPTIDENHPQNADSPYGVSKLAAEKMILAYSGIYDITAVCLRYFNIYGVNQRFDLYGNVIPIFAKRIFAGEPITIYGDGEQTRDFVNVDDVARANLLASKSDNGTDVYNLGSGGSVTINWLAKTMQDIAGLHVGIQYAPERPADVRHCKANADKILSALDFRANVDLESGLEKYIKWYKENCV
ncbi:MAG: SDR family NAD(P)-dependent oxidoreductase [Lachnospiraceae bacterium]|nr:SDR family NAD(P)-dependent oxidoreductase [Lachnospiraceae bacterium]